MLWVQDPHDLDTGLRASFPHILGRYGTVLCSQVRRVRAEGEKGDEGGARARGGERGVEAEVER